MRVWVVLVGAVVVSAEPELVFKTQAFKREAPADGPGTTHVYGLAFPTPESRYPEAKRLCLERALLDVFYKTEAASDEPDALLQLVAHDFNSDYADFLHEFPDYRHVWEDRRSVRVLLQVPELLVIASDHWEYTGGAHGNGGIHYTLFDLAAGAIIPEERWYKLGVEGVVTAKVKAVLMKKYKASNDQELQNAGIWVKDLHPGQLFADKDGLGMSYNPYDISPYDISPYVMGRITVRFTFAELEPELNPGTVLYHYLSRVYPVVE